jgi:mannitol operon repressor
MPSNDDDRRIAFMVGGYNSDTKEFTDFLGEFNKESDRGAVLASAAYIDSLLAETLRSFLIDNKSAADMVDEYPGAMSSFSSRILACHAMGLISDDERTECNIIRKVRNEFAHHARKSLAEKDIESFCSSLKFIIKPVANDPPPNTRMRFTSSAVELISRFMKRPKAVEALRLKPLSWH